MIIDFPQKTRVRVETETPKPLKLRYSERYSAGDPFARNPHVVEVKVDPAEVSKAVRRARGEE